METLGKILNIVQSKVNNIGLFIFAGVDEYDNRIMEIIEPTLKLDIFIYNCSNKFQINHVNKYLTNVSGSIIFANGDECFIYQMSETDFEFKKFKHITANLQKRQKKGGQSAVRIARLAEETRHNYIVHILDYLNQLTTTINLVYGSIEIINMIFELKSRINTTLINCGFLDFDSNTIKQTTKWMEILINTNNMSNITSSDKLLEKFVEYLDNQIDMLDFDPLLSNTSIIQYYTKSNPNSMDLSNSKFIQLNVNHESYNRLRIFDYISIKYYAFESVDLID